MVNNEKTKNTYLDGLRTGVLYGTIMTFAVIGIIDKTSKTSVDPSAYVVSISQPYQFNNPVAIDATPSDIEKILAARPVMQDITVKLPSNGAEVAKFRTVTDPTTKKVLAGALDYEGNLISVKEKYVLNFAHDANWYVKNNKR